MTTTKGDDRAQEALRLSESRYRRLFEAAQDGILLLNSDTAQIEDVNPYLIDMLGYSHEELLGKKLWDVGAFADIPQSKDMFAELQAKGYARLDNLPLKTKAGGSIDVEFVCNSYSCEGLKVIQCNIRNISDRTAAEEEARLHTRLYTALSACNRTIVHCTTEAELFERVCRIVVQLGAMRMAWIGVVDPGSATVRPVASFGDDSGYLRDIRLSASDESPFGRGPTGTAIRTDRPVWTHDAEAHVDVSPWSALRRRSGFLASGSLPLRRNGVVVGALSVYSGDVSTFNHSTRDLLLEIATDIGFAMDGFAREALRARAEAAVIESEAQLAFTERVSRTGGWSVDLRNHESRRTVEHDRIFGYSSPIPQWSHEIFLEHVLPEDRAEVDRTFRENVARHIPLDHECRIRRTDGEVRWIRVVSGDPQQGADASERVSGMVQDITERKHAEIRVSYLNRVYGVLSSINTLIVRVRDREQLFREVCNIAVTTGGFRMAQIGLVGTPGAAIRLAASASTDDELLATVARYVSSPETVELTMMARSVLTGEVVVANDSQNDPQLLLRDTYAAHGVRSVAVLPLTMGNAVIGTFALYASEVDFFHAEELRLLVELAGDVAFAIGHIQQQERLEYLAYFDDLTELANRSQFTEQVGRQIATAIPGQPGFALLLIDLERFRNVNDSLGREAGDQILQQVARWLAGAVGADCRLARVGPDLFALLLPEAQDVAAIGQRVTVLMESFLHHPFRVNEAEFRIAAKGGMALFPDHGTDPDTLLRHAELALKKAKASGDRYLLYTTQMTEAVAGRLRLETQLRQAVEKGEFVLHYQPKVSMATGAVTGAEALIRWNDPHTGLVPPGQFIPILEETGMIYEVGRWALRTAVEDYLGWRAAGRPAVRVAVNVSPLQLHDQGFFGEIERIVAINADAAAGLEIEITESLIMEDVQRSIEVLKAIRALGVSIAIDDFGTGFSSLSYLAKLPVNSLKIDRSFVVDMTTGPEALALVATIISLAHGMKLSVVAEGVETDAQSRMLALLGCNEIQGFLICKPVPRQVFENSFLTVPTTG